MFNKNKQKNKIQNDSKISILEQIIDDQNKELIRLRGIQSKINEYDKTQKEMEDIIKVYSSLCDDLSKYRYEYKKLNEELNAVIADYKEKILHS